jgi:general secretion pathway protein K
MNHRPRQNGFILVVVLGAVMALCALLVGFSQSSRTSLGKADSFYRTEQAWHSAWAGLQIAVALVHDANESGLDPEVLTLLSERRVFPVGDANSAVTIAEENGLLNVNRLIATDGQPDRKHVDQFLRLLDALNREKKDGNAPLGYGLVPAAIDWIDSDNEVTCLPFVQHENLGAENDYYQTLRPPYSCRNGPVGTVEELSCIKGMTPPSFERLRPLLTCVGDGKVDLNAAPPLVLESLSEQMDPAVAQMVIQQRKYRPLRTMADLRAVPGMTDNLCRDIETLGTLRPEERFYRVHAQGGAGEHRCTIEALLRKNTHAQTVDILQYREL